jgi:hypothetical protein
MAEVCRRGQGLGVRQAAGQGSKFKVQSSKFKVYGSPDTRVGAFLQASKCVFGTLVAVPVLAAFMFRQPTVFRLRRSLVAENEFAEGSALRKAF